MRRLNRLSAAILDQSRDLFDVPLVIGAKLTECLAMGLIRQRVDGNAVRAHGVVIELQQIIQRCDARHIAGQHESVRHGSLRGKGTAELLRPANCELLRTAYCVPTRRDQVFLAACSSQFAARSSQLPWHGPCPRNQTLSGAPMTDDRNLDGAAEREELLDELEEN